MLGLAGLQYFLAVRCGHGDGSARAALLLRSRDRARNLWRPALAPPTWCRYRHHPKVIGLAEFMNVPGVLNKDPECMEKLAAFQGAAHRRPCARCFPADALNAYLSCGIRNCHETTNLAEGREKLAKGMQVLIREGSASKDLAALVPLIGEFASPFLGFCTDDRNPLDIHEEGHMDYLVRRAIALGAPVAAVYRTASWSAARGFGLRDRGLMRSGVSGGFPAARRSRELRDPQLSSAGADRVTRETFAGRVAATAAGRQLGAPGQPVTAGDIRGARHPARRRR